ncbi:MAG: hypothetical protein MPN21_23100 [Thermoanaerobaculia bacterium]|nr:hypothetical protein [Thermoanaerobaculia bacterium]
MLASTAWICDDAFITFRSVEQLLEGNGPRWNPHERVQAFTHPLWFGSVALVRSFVGDPALAAQVLSWVLAMALVWTLGRRAQPTLDRVVLLLVLVLGSRAFVDFSSSGLEDPLSHFLLVLFASRLLRPVDSARLQQLRQISWPAGLLLLCRHDNLWLVGPGVLWLAWNAWKQDGASVRRIAKAGLPGFAPFLAWTIFATGYYGFPFPNTAYAKLNTGVEGHELWWHGVRYLIHTAAWDPVTVIVLVVGACLAFRAGGAGAMLASGVGLHVLYVTRIGGDFMAGRFLTEPFVVGLVAVVLLAKRPTLRPAWALATAFVVFWPLSPFKIDDAYQSYRPEDHAGIADERSFYTGRTGFHGFERRWPIPLWRSIPGPQEHFEVGFSGFSTGTEEIVIDRFALADPLLARLPADEDWKRIGHFRRSLPAGYEDSLKSDSNQIQNPFVHRLYDDLRLVTQGSLWAPGRWSAILRLNLFPQRPGCPAPPCRKLVTHVLPTRLFSPLLAPVDPAEGGIDRVVPAVASGSTPTVSIEGRVPFDLLADDQLVRLFLPEHPAEQTLQLLPDQDPSGAFQGFRAVLEYPDPSTARRVASQLCAAAAAHGGAWQLLPRLDASTPVCSGLTLEP